ncbi:MAG: hypothetical protein ACRDMV_10685 [Streptosporangiales bacterium]
MEIIEPDYAQQAIERVAAGEDLDTVWNTTPRRDLTATDIGLEEDGGAVNPEARRNYANAEYQRWLRDDPGELDERTAADLVHEEESRRQALEAEEDRLALDNEHPDQEKEIAS